MLLLTESGEFVAKNLVLIGATLVLMVHSRVEALSPASEQTSPARSLWADMGRP